MYSFNLVKSIVEEVLEQETGYTFARNTRRYVASLKDGLQYKLNSSYEELELSDIDAIAFTVRSVIENCPTGFFPGIWYHENTLYIDINRSFDGLEEALKFGAENGQLAIYDTALDREIAVNPTDLG